MDEHAKQAVAILDTLKPEGYSEQEVAAVAAALRGTYTAGARAGLAVAAAQAKALGVRDKWRVGELFQYEECPEKLADDIAKAIRAIKAEEVGGAQGTP